VTRRFGTFTALDTVDFAIDRGEIHALLGENGAGKSTLMNVLSGLLAPSEGTLSMDGRDVAFASPADAAARGIGMVHQHFLLVPPLSVAENLLLGASADKGGPLSYPIRTVLDEAKALAERLGWTIPWEHAAGSLPVGTQQRVEILKALRGETKLLIFDEPTAVLTPTETPELFATIRRLAAEGRGIVFISHKLDEVLELAGRITVLRRGRVVARLDAASSDAPALARAMVGDDSKAAEVLRAGQTPAAATPTPGGVRLELRGLTVDGQGRRALDSVSFSVTAGEILGIAGVDGNGQEPLGECLAGLRRPTSGEILVDGRALAPDPNAFRHAGIGVIPADRQRRGLALSLTITENLTLGVQDDPAYRRGPLLRWGALRARATEKIRRFDIRAQGPDDRAGALSGGNQQKVVIARALSGEPKVIVAVNPTRGLDVGAIGYVHAALRAAQAAGAAIVLISTELDEVRALSARIGVLFDGRLVGVVPADTPRETLGRLMGGAA
jgi:simple sugar transport system ATP-binding protein